MIACRSETNHNFDQDSAHIPAKVHGDNLYLISVHCLHPDARTQRSWRNLNQVQTPWQPVVLYPWQNRCAGWILSLGVNHIQGHPGMNPEVSRRENPLEERSWSRVERSGGGREVNREVKPVGTAE